MAINSRGAETRSDEKWLERCLAGKEMVPHRCGAAGLRRARAK